MKTIGKSVSFLIGCLAVTRAFALDLPAPTSFLDLPASTAHIADRYPATLQSAPEYILIQDLHRHPEVQQHIADILTQVQRQWGLHQVFVEGAFAEVHVSPTEKEIDMTGAELAATREPLHLQGIEDRDLYEEHLTVYERILERRELALGEIDRIQNIQKELQLPAVHPMVQQLERVRQLVQLKMTPRVYADYLSQKALSPHSAALTPVIADAERFYELTDARNDVFLRNAGRYAADAQGLRVLVVGGFHTEGLARRLRAQGHSYIVLAPTVTQGGYDKLYEKRMIDTVSALQISHPFINSR